MKLQISQLAVGECLSLVQHYRIFGLLLFIAVYIPYSTLVTSFMCMTESPTCCQAETVARKKLPKRVSHFNPLDNTEFLVNTDKCQNITKGGNRVWLLIGVVSYVHFFELRDAIRQTYGFVLKRRSPGPVCLIFIVGTQKKHEKFDVIFQNEVDEHKDIVQIDREDTYDNLVYKSIALLKWAYDHVKRFDFLMKMDDDTFLNIHNLFHKLLVFSSHSRFIMGHRLNDARPKRFNFSQHYISKTDYSGKILPNYMMGPSYVISGDLVNDLLGVIPRIPLVHVEDVYITGILASYVGDVTHIGQCGFVRKKDDVYGLPMSSVTVHDLLRWDIVLVLDDVLHSSQRVAVSLQ